MDLPEWLRNRVIVGFDEGDDQAPEGDEDEGADDDEDDEDSPPEDNTALKKALEAERQKAREERKARRKAERDLRAAQAAKVNSDEAKTSEELQNKLILSEQKTSKLAGKLLTNAINSAVMDEATRQGFIDPTDALVSAVLSEVEVDQDPDDPSDIEVDADTVEAAVKKYAARKKHLLGQPGDNGPSGTRFKKGNRGDNATNESTLKTMYPSLN
jgi:hypothetical protein